MRIDYEALPLPVRGAVEERTGRVHSSRTAEAGNNSAVASFLDTETGSVFLKGLPRDHPAMRDQERESRVAPYMAEVSPRLLWHATAAGWDLLAFEAIDQARHVDYAPDSPDVPKVLKVLEQLSEIACPPVPMFSAERRWQSALDDPEDGKRFAGPHLAHTDWHPGNVLIAGGRVWLVDWALSTRGARWIDPALLLPRLIAAGHDPEEAEERVSNLPAWQTADPVAVSLFAEAVAHMWQRLAAQDVHGAWRRPGVEAATRWAGYRRATRRLPPPASPSPLSPPSSNAPSTTHPAGPTTPR